MQIYELIFFVAHWTVPVSQDDNKRMLLPWECAKSLSEYLPPANIVCEGYVFTPVCDSVNRGVACMVAPRGGMHSCSQGGHVWLLWGGMCGCSGGACVVALGGHAWLLWGGGMHGCSGGACMVSLGGMRGFSGGHAWLLQGGHAWDMTRYTDTVNERAVRILLECILVSFNFYPFTDWYN